jgi:hypothetical protein
MSNLATKTQRHREKNKSIFQVSAPHFHVKIRYKKCLCGSVPQWQKIQYVFSPHPSRNHGAHQRGKITGNFNFGHISNHDLVG